MAREVKKENPYMYYGIGVYKYNKKDFFIKTWTGRLKDYRYYDLVNEYILNKLLHRMLVDRKIYIPEIIACKIDRINKAYLSWLIKESSD